MKRKLALLMAGCLAVSPLSAGLLSIQTLAAEQAGNDAASDAALFSVTVSDENDTELDEGAEYPLTSGETRSLKAVIGGTGESS